MSINVSSVIGASTWNQGFQKRSGIDLLPIQLKNGSKAIFSNLGGNLLSFEVPGKKGPIDITQCTLDFSNPTFDLPSLKMMGQIRGLFPVMYPNVGRITELPGGQNISKLNEILGYRMFKEKIGIHGAAHNRLWEITDEGSHGDIHRVVAEFNVSANENADIFKVFGAGTVKRIFDIKPVVNGAEIEVETILNGIRVIGDHSFYNTPNRKETTLEAKGASLWAVDKDNVPTGKLVDGGMFDNPKVLDKHFDGTFTSLGFNTIKPAPEVIATIFDQKEGLEIAIAQSEIFTHRTVFTPMQIDGNPESYICVEPSTTSTDAYNLAKTIYGLATPYGTSSKEAIAGKERITVTFK